MLLLAHNQCLANICKQQVALGIQEKQNEARLMVLATYER